MLDEKQAEMLERMWNAYWLANKAEFLSRLERIDRRDMLNDQLYLSSALRKKLFHEGAS